MWQARTIACINKRGVTTSRHTCIHTGRHNGACTYVHRCISDVVHGHTHSYIAARIPTPMHNNTRMHAYCTRTHTHVRAHSNTHTYTVRTDIHIADCGNQHSCEATTYGTYAFCVSLVFAGGQSRLQCVGVAGSVVMATIYNTMRTLGMPWAAHASRWLTQLHAVLQRNVCKCLCVHAVCIPTHYIIHTHICIQPYTHTHTSPSCNTHIHAYTHPLTHALTPYTHTHIHVHAHSSAHLHTHRHYCCTCAYTQACIHTASLTYMHVWTLHPHTSHTYASTSTLMHPHPISMRRAFTTHAYWCARTHACNNARTHPPIHIHAYPYTHTHTHARTPMQAYTHPHTAMQSARHTAHKSMNAYCPTELHAYTLYIQPVPHICITHVHACKHTHVHTCSHTTMHAYSIGGAHNQSTTYAYNHLPIHTCMHQSTQGVANTHGHPRTLACRPRCTHKHTVIRTHCV